jgi:hypothetical protein
MFVLDAKVGAQVRQTTDASPVLYNTLLELYLKQARPRRPYPATVATRMA